MHKLYKLGICLTHSALASALIHGVLAASITIPNHARHTPSNIYPDWWAG